MSKLRLPVFGRHTIPDDVQGSASERFDQAGRRRVEGKFALEVDHADVNLTIPASGPRGGYVPARLFATPPIRIRFVDTGLVREMHTAPVLTNTTKMRAPSFSLPAGPRSMGGSCPASDGEPRANRAWICHVCYAYIGNNYMRTANQARQRMRLKWVLGALRAGTFIDGMTAVLEEMLRAEPPYWDARYFRVHDSGDFMANPRYVLAWNEIARRFMNRIVFWAPTRDWVFFDDPAVRRRVEPHGFTKSVPGLADAMRAAPPNLLLRPSALEVGEEPPRIEGLAAGSTVLALDDFDGIERCSRSARGAHCHCPAYELGGSCEAARCRTCWDAPSRSVDYPEH